MCVYGGLEVIRMFAQAIDKVIRQKGSEGVIGTVREGLRRKEGVSLMGACITYLTRQ